MAEEHPRKIISKLLNQHKILHEITVRGAIHVPVQTTRQRELIAKMGRKVVGGSINAMFPNATIDDALLRLKLYRGVKTRLSATLRPRTKIVKITFPLD